MILNVFSKATLTDEEKESRDEFLTILEEHIDDIAAHVRAKVFQNWSRLQSHNAVPIKMQHSVLEKAVLHLRDKGAFARKAAAGCVTTFLMHNMYGARLQLNEMLEELEKKENELKVFKDKLVGIEEQKIQEIERNWEEKVEAIRAVVEKALQG